MLNKIFVYLINAVSGLKLCQCICLLIFWCWFDYKQCPLLALAYLSHLNSWWVMGGSLLWLIFFNEKRKRYWRSLSLSLSSCMHRKEVMWGHSKKVGIFNSRRESAHQTPTLWAPWSYTSSLRSCEERILCCLSHPACGLLSWQPKLTNTQVEFVSAGHLHCG